MLPGEICCLDDTENRVAIGAGDTCCGTVPYYLHGSQMCCSGKYSCVARLEVVKIHLVMLCFRHYDVLVRDT